jgi:hypothetical protein
MGNKGMSRLMQLVTLSDILVQQLLAIWNKAKGKEKDALLWGDEVCSPY